MSFWSQANRLHPPKYPAHEMVSPTILVIGYGNTLRGDDGVGYQVAEAIQAWDLDGVKALPCHQLTPELAAEIALAQQVIFVDAAIAPSSNQPDMTLESITPEVGIPFTTHAATPSALLALAKWLYDVAPIASQLTIPAHDFDMGETLSPITARGKVLALARLRMVLQHTNGDAPN